MARLVRSQRQMQDGSEFATIILQCIRATRGEDVALEVAKGVLATVVAILTRRLGPEDVDAIVDAAQRAAAADPPPNKH
jgi:hypothetical protein